MFKSIIYDIQTIILKEYWEFKKGIKFLGLYMLLGLIPLILNLKHPNSILPDNLIFISLFMLVSIGCSQQIVSDSIRGESNSKTLEYLLSSNISIMSIFLGKVILPVLFGYVTALLSLLVFRISSYNIYAVHESSINICFFFIMFIITFIGVCISIISTIVIKEEKVSPVIGVLVTLVVFLGIGYIYIKVISNIYVFTLMCILLSILFTFLGTTALKKVDFISIE